MHLLRWRKAAPYLGSLRAILNTVSETFFFLIWWHALIFRKKKKDEKFDVKLDKGDGGKPEKNDVKAEKGDVKTGKGFGEKSESVILSESLITECESDADAVTAIPMTVILPHSKSPGKTPSAKGKLSHFKVPSPAPFDDPAYRTLGLDVDDPFSTSHSS